jgi:hypothetical protein
MWLFWRWCDIEDKKRRSHMDEATKRLFIGIKITKALQDDLDSPAPGTKQYFEGNNSDYLQIVNLREEKFIGRYLKDGFPVISIGDVSRNVCSIVKLITRGRRIEENEVHIYSC